MRTFCNAVLVAAETQTSLVRSNCLCIEIFDRKQAGSGILSMLLQMVCPESFLSLLVLLGTLELLLVYKVKITEVK